MKSVLTTSEKCWKPWENVKSRCPVSPKFEGRYFNFVFLKFSFQQVRFIFPYHAIFKGSSSVEEVEALVFFQIAKWVSHRKELTPWLWRGIFLNWEIPLLSWVPRVLREWSVVLLWGRWNSMSIGRLGEAGASEYWWRVVQQWWCCFDYVFQICWVYGIQRG